MFAGAAREAVFSNPEVIRRVNADFVPVALKAALVNNPGHDEEGRLYRQIGRSKPAPQGICVANSAAQALAWALSFDDEKSLMAFLDRVQEQFRQHPDGKQSVVTERYMRFPSQRLNDVNDESEPPVIVETHPVGHACCANPPLPPGTVVARVYGRALGPDGRPLNDTVRQEHYVEDRFNVSVEMQETLAQAFAEASRRRTAIELATKSVGRSVLAEPSEQYAPNGLAARRDGLALPHKAPNSTAESIRRVRLPNEFARLCVTYAYLGVLDVRPLANPAGGTSDLKQCEFFAERVDDRPRWRINGQSDVASEADRRFGKSYQHDVKLSWEGYIEMDGKRMRRLLLSAHGTEGLKWREDHALVETADQKNEVAFLPAGHRINMTCGVRYGIIAEPSAASRN